MLACAMELPTYNLSQAHGSSMPLLAGPESAQQSSVEVRGRDQAVPAC